MSNEKVKIIKDQGGRYLIPSNSIIYKTLSSGDTIRTVNGIELPQPTYQSKTVQIPKPNNITVTRKYNVKVAYEDKNGKVLFIEEYNNLLSELTSKGEYYDDEWTFENIDDEYNHKKFIQSYKAIYEDKEEQVVFTNFDYIETIVSEYEHITPVQSVVDNPEEMLFLFTPTTKLMLTEVAKMLGYTFYEDHQYGSLKESEKLRTITVSNHSNYEYTKINGNYIGSDQKHKFNSVRSFRGTYNECVKEKERQVKMIYDILKPYDDRLNQKKLTSTNVGEILTFLSFIGNRINNLDVKKLDLSTQRAIVSSINTKINELTNL
jgi:hypothetical protein